MRGVFVNTMTANEHYSFRSKKIIQEPIQLQLSQKQNFFSQFFAGFLKSTRNFEHLQKR